MEYNQILKNAKENMGGFCIGCPICNGLACKTKVPGPGGKGYGDSYIRNFDKLGDVKINMDTLFESSGVNTELEMFGKKFDLPVFAAPIGATTLHYGDYLSEEEYFDALFKGCKESGIAAFGGDGPAKAVFEMPLEIIKKIHGHGVSTIKPWNLDEIKRKIKLVEESGAFAVATDVDGSGLTLLKKTNTPVGPKSPADLKEIVNATKLPVIIKGIMTVQGAKKAVEAGAYAIVVSNHGGRVLDQTPATIEVLAEIVEAVSGQIKILIDGGIRTGMDIFKCLALGADAVLIGRPFATMVYGGGQEGVETLVKKLKTELEETMEMAGANNLSEIKQHMVRV